MAVFLWQNKQLQKFVKKNLLIYRYSEIIRYTLLFSFYNGSSLMPAGWKLGGVGFEVTGNVIFEESGLYNMLGYLDTWSGFEAAKTAPWPNRGLHHCGKFLEPSDE